MLMLNTVCNVSMCCTKPKKYIGIYVIFIFTFYIYIYLHDPQIYLRDPQTKPHAEPKFIVFYGMLMSLFSMFCFNCKSASPKVEITRNGSLATATQICKACPPDRFFQWRSQPFVLGRHPAGNVMMGFSILMSGININQVMLMFKHMNLLTISLRTYFRTQSKFLFPFILKHWESYQENMIVELKNQDGRSTWSGDGRFDSMGHSAKYGAYTMFSNTISKLVHFELLQVQYRHY